MSRVRGQFHKDTHTLAKSIPKKNEKKKYFAVVVYSVHLRWRRKIQRKNNVPQLGPGGLLTGLPEDHNGIPPVVLVE